MGWDSVLTRQRLFIAFNLWLLLSLSPLATPFGGTTRLLFEIPFGFLTPLTVSVVVGRFW